MNKKSILKDELLWPGNMAEKIHSGFSDDELESLCDWGLRGYDRKLPYKSPHWLYWPAELYSFGRCYREWLGLPSWFPLPLYGDHGVATSGDLSPHEKNSKPKVHLTWFKDRAESLKNNSTKKILHIPHPWVVFRHRYGLKKKENAYGTLVFFSHSNTGIEIVDYDFDKYFSELELLPDEYHPLVICMHRHDVEKKYHLKMRKYGLPVISAGETSSPYFVDRFYSMISRFNFATSNSGGSELFYCEEFGVPYFIKGEQPTYVNFSHNESPLGVLKSRDVVGKLLELRRREIFSVFPPRKSAERMAFVNSVLGLDVDESMAKKLVRNEFFKELLRHPKEIILALLLGLFRAMLPYRILMLVRKAKKHITTAIQ